MQTPVDILVQARMGSRRLPGKSLMKIDERELIGHVFDGVHASQEARAVILCTTDTHVDDALADFARSEGIACFRGSEEDVLLRFIEAGSAHQSEAIVRVCADNPFVNGEEIDRLIVAFFAGNYDYGFNHVPTDTNNYPDGLGAEIVRLKTLKSIYPECDQLDREHVTRFIRGNAKRFKVVEPPAPAAIADPTIKLDVDTQEDFERIQALLDFMRSRGQNPRRASDVVQSYREFVGPSRK